MLTPEYTLAALRSAALRARLLVNELDLITLAVRDGLIAPESALLWARDVGGLEIIGADDADFDRADMLEVP